MLNLRSLFASTTVAVMLVAIPSCEKDDYEGAKAEVQETNIKLSLPEVPNFNVPAANADGSHPVAEMRLRGKRFLGTEVRVKGYVIWTYDCEMALRTPEMSVKDVKKLLAEQPDKCYRPNFYLGGAKDAKTDKGLWVVEYPRPPREDEKKNLPDEDVAAMEAAFAALPKFDVGDEVVVTGTWALSSPRGFKNSDGLLVYKSMQNLTTPAPAPEAPK